MVMNADNVAGISLFDMRPILRHKNGGIGEFDVFVDAVVANGHTFLEFTRANTEKCDAVTMGRVHIGLNLEAKAGEIFLVGFYHTLFCRARAGMWGELNKSIKQFTHTEIIHSTAEKHRCLRAVEEMLQIKICCGTLQ